ncbi:MAG: alpha/beta hydrolase [Clostridia bacterium]|nr:alpha/beta hydrolase [Clostridia bacterium]
MVIFISVLVTALILFLIFFLLCFVAFKKIFSREKSRAKTEQNFYKRLKKHKGETLIKNIKNNSSAFEDAEYKEVAILSIDNYHLCGRLYMAKNGEGKKSVILCHGYRTSGTLDFGNAFKMYREMNYNILVIDERAYGKSQGKYTSMGIMESFDIICWCKWLELCFGTETDIILHGVSTGAFASVAAAANPEIPLNVKGIIAESAYPLIRDFVYKFAEKNLAFLTKPAIPFINLFYKNHVGFDMRDFSLYTVSKSVKIPVLFVHSKNDSTAPFNNTESLVGRIPAKAEIVKIEKAPHGLCFAKENKKCEEAVKKFIGEL